MPNWCVCALRVRGKQKDLQNFVLEGLKPCDPLKKEHAKLELDEFGYVGCNEKCWIEGTRRGFVYGLDVYFEDYEDDSIQTIALDAEFAWAISSEELLKVCQKYHVDMRIYAFKKGMEFNLEIEIINGKITKDSYFGF
mgnify:FL=1|jgi:hypothetical protein